MSQVMVVEKKQSERGAKIHLTSSTDNLLPTSITPGDS